MKQLANEYQRAHLLGTIKTMRDACYRAERIVERDYSPEAMIAGVVHEFAWAMANANSTTESALMECERIRERGE